MNDRRDEGPHVDPDDPFHRWCDGTWTERVAERVGAGVARHQADLTKETIVPQRPSPSGFRHDHLGRLERRGGVRAC
jgi:hypothetical protein